MKIINSNLTFKSLTDLGKVKRIILHHAEANSCSIEDIHRWHLNNGWSGCGYHFFVRKDGSIYRGRPENKLGSHTGNYNTGSLGVCFEGNFNKEHMPAEQLKSGQELITYLVDKYGLLKANVYKHKDFNSTDCPGANFPFNQLQQGAYQKPIVNQSVSVVDELKQECDKQGFGYYPTVSKGAKGNITKIIQRILINQGYKLPSWGADGSFGNETIQSVKQFQKDSGLIADGIVGKNTWNKLLK